jgi:hypothetical protein
MKQLNELVELALRTKPETRESNDVLWVEIASVLCIVENITDVNDLFMKVLSNEIPSSHSVAAAASIVRKQHPELKPSTTSTNRKNEIKQQYAQEYRNA